MIIKKSTITLFMCLLASNYLFSQSSIEGAKLLSLSLSPKVNALGQSYAAIYNDIDAVEENPAGAIYSSSLNFNLIASTWIGDVDYLDTKAIIPLNIRALPACNLLITSVYLFYPNIPHYDISGDISGNIPISEGYTGIGLSTILFSSLPTGFLLKYAYRDINGKSYPALAFDLGFQFPYLLKQSLLNFGLVLKNIGYDFNNESLPTEIVLGASKDFFNATLLLKLDLGFPDLNGQNQFFNGTFISFGAEYNIYQYISLRLGLKYDAAGGAAPSIGLGTGLKKINSWGLYWSIDYAYIPIFNIDEYNNQQIAISIRFYTSEEKKENIIMFQKYQRFGMLAYLKGDLEEAIQYWEQALQYGKSEEVDKLLEQSKLLLKEKKDKEKIYGK